MSKSSKCQNQCEEGFALSSAEIIPGRFYFMVLRAQQRPKYTMYTHYFSIDDELKYDPFYDDFGPLNLAQMHRYCQIVDDKLKSTTLQSKKIVYLTSFEAQKRVNAAYLVGSYMVLYMNMSASDVLQKLMSTAHPFISFRDASVGMPHYTIELSDCINAVAKAKECGFYNPMDFSEAEYLHYETVQNGDLNWIIPEKFLAFAGPQSLEYRSTKWNHSMTTHTPESYISYFKALNVKTVVRLNNRCYDASKFTEAGIAHHDLIFVDGGIPTNNLVDQFLDIAENSPGAIAVHCKAGLGRTGSMIACYLMKWYRFTAREAIAWCRICRPASIIGHQQHWLEIKQVEMWLSGMKLTRPYHSVGVYSKSTGVYNRSSIRGISFGSIKNVSDKSSNDALCGITSKVTTMNINNSDINKNITSESANEISQGDRLQKIKMDRITPRSTTRSIMRSSWPVTGCAQSKRGGTWPSPAVVSKRSTTVGCKISGKRSLKKKVMNNGPKVDEPRNVVTSPVLDSAGPPLRRSSRILEPRLCKSVILR